MPGKCGNNGVADFFHRTPFLFPLLCLGGGIVSSGFFRLPVVFFYVFSGIAFLLFLFAPRHFSLPLFLYGGIFLVGLSCCPRPVVLSEGCGYLSCRCEELLGQGGYVFSVSGCRLYLKMSDSLSVFAPGDSLYAYGRVFPLKNRKNNGEFDYDRYLKQKGVTGRFIPDGSFIKSVHSGDNFAFFPYLRKKLGEKIDRLWNDREQRAVVKALCLGYKEESFREVRVRFAETGTVHLLAVSGLHTGALYLLLVFVFRCVGLSGPKSRLLILPLLWGYACLTGLSPSVVRAAGILSFVIAGNAFTRDYTTFNSIAASAFFTLLFSPALLYTVSMQMSYAAYTGIVVLYPFFEKFRKKIPFFLRPVYSLAAVSFSAQLATLPLSAFYFHTLAPAGIVTNLLAVPLATLLLYASFLLLLLPVAWGMKLVFLARGCCDLLFFCLDKFGFAGQRIEGLYPDAVWIIGFYVVLGTGMLYPMVRKRYLFRLLLAGMGGLLVYSCFSVFRDRSRKEIAVFHLYGKSCVLLNYKGSYTFLYSSADSADVFRILPYVRRNRLSLSDYPENFILTEGMYADFCFKGRSGNIRLLLPGGEPSGEAAVWIVCRNVYPDRWKDSTFLPGTVVLDASNHFVCIRKWEEFCRERDLVLLKTEDHGTLTLLLE